MRMRLLSIGIVLVPGLVASEPVVAQIRGSEAAVVSQTVDGTRITIEYSRPRAAGRTLFGDLVAWGQPWTGANWATTLELNRDARLNGTDVPAGKYSVWWVPQPDRWTLLLDRNAKLFHFQKPTPSPEHIRIEVEPRQAEHVEMLTWSFPAVTGDAATVQMQWGTTVAPVQIVVQPTKPVALAPEDRAAYVGAYELDVMEGLGWPRSARFEVYESGDMLRGRLPFPIHPGDELEFDLVPAGQNRLSAGLYRGGKLFNIEMGATFEFDVDDDRAHMVRLRGIEGTVFASGRRVAN
ncbi:MAG TPA: DUF2911 domain-containing protein [Longimicrobiales bacterium]